MKSTRLAIVGALVFAVLESAAAQQASKHVLSSDEVKKPSPRNNSSTARKRQCNFATRSASS